jgi:acyl-CoA thioesterase I
MTDPLAPIRLTFFGDSICVGQGVSIFRGWVTQIARDMEQLSHEIGREILVTNASVNGRTTRQALEDMPYSVQSPGVDIMVTQFGLNDCNYWASDRGVPRVSRAAFAANMIEIMSRARAFGAKAIFLNTNHPTTRSVDVLPHTSMTYEMSNQQYSQTLRDVAHSAGSNVTFTDIEDIFRKEIETGTALADLLLKDGLHLSSQGHEIYYRSMAPALRNSVLAFAGHK